MSELAKSTPLAGSADALEAVGGGRPRGLLAQALSRVVRDREGLVGLSILGVLALLAILAPVIAPFDPLRIGAGFPFEAPGRAHFFGTDDLGRDVFSRVIHGGRISLSIAVLSAAAALLLAIPLGVLAGYNGGVIDAAIARLFDTIFAFPAVLIGIGFVAILGPNLRNVVLAVAIINVPTLGRLTRISILAQKNLEYVEAARAAGASQIRIAIRHILPNALPPLFVQVALVMSEAVLLEAAFSFLGLGSRPPTPSWGVMLNEGRNFLSQAWWLGFFPGLTIMLMIFALNSVGDSLRSALNPRRR